MTGRASNFTFDPTANLFDRNSERCLDGRITDTGKYPVACGGHADVWRGQLAHHGVAIKVMRPWSSAGKRVEQAKMLKRLWREYLAWSSLSHPNVIELLGFSYDFCPEWFNFPALISPWMSNGTVDTYIEHHSIKNRLDLLVGIAEGLSYLHTREPAIIHGDLRAGNVLVSDSGVPCLSDFGLSRVISEAKRATTSSSEPAGSLRWMSPELFRNDGGVSVHSDVWAFGMTVLEVLTGNRPYSRSKSDVFVLGQIACGIPPLRERLFDNDLWIICCRCWYIRPSERPSMRNIISQLSEYTFAAYNNRGISSEKPVVGLYDNPGISEKRGRKLDKPSLADENHGLPDQDYFKALPARSRTQSGPSIQDFTSASIPAVVVAERNLVGREDLKEMQNLDIAHGAAPKKQTANTVLPRLRDSLWKLVCQSRHPKTTWGVGSTKRPPRQSGSSRHQLQLFQDAQILTTGPLPPNLPPVSHSDTITIPPRIEMAYPDLSLTSLDRELKNYDPPLEEFYLFRKDDEGCLDGSVTGIRDLRPSSHTDVWKGDFGDLEVAIKTIIPFGGLGSQARERRILERLWLLYRRATSSQHPNILRYLGFSYDIFPEPPIVPALISPWMSKGTLSSYLAKFPDVDIYGLARGVARGLNYLHAQEQPITHGDIRAENVLISESGVPCLSDVHITDVLKIEGVYNSTDAISSLRWTSPELLQSDAEPTLASDVWAYGMTLLEMFSGNIPYQEVKSTASVFDRIQSKLLPVRPASPIPNDIWKICLSCWYMGFMRPTIRIVLGEIEAAGTHTNE